MIFIWIIGCARAVTPVAGDTLQQKLKDIATNLKRASANAGLAGKPESQQRLKDCCNWFVTVTSNKDVTSLILTKCEIRWNINIEDISFLSNGQPGDFNMVFYGFKPFSPKFIVADNSVNREADHSLRTDQMADYLSATSWFGFNKHGDCWLIRNAGLPELFAAPVRQAFSSMMHDLRKVIDAAARFTP
jgi:hypothetical protein